MAGFGYFHQCPNYLSVEYAKSNKASCLFCFNNIDKSSLRFGITGQVECYDTTKFCHFDCLKVLPEKLKKNVSLPLPGTKLLSQSDVSRVESKIKAILLSKPTKTKFLFEEDENDDSNFSNSADQQAKDEKKGAKKKKSSKKGKKEEVDGDAVDETGSKRKFHTAINNQSAKITEEENQLKNKSNDWLKKQLKANG